MKSIMLRLLATLIFLPIQAAFTFLLIGIAQSEFGADTQVPYGLLAYFPLIPLLCAIWIGRGSIGRRVAAWAVGLAAVVTGVLVTYLVVLRIWSAAVLGGADPFGAEAGWAVVVFYILCIAAGVVPVWALLRRAPENSKQLSD